MNNAAYAAANISNGCERQVKDAGAAARHADPTLHRVGDKMGGDGFTSASVGAAHAIFVVDIDRPAIAHGDAHAGAAVTRSRRHRHADDAHAGFGDSSSMIIAAAASAPRHAMWALHHRDHISFRRSETIASPFMVSP